MPFTGGGSNVVEAGKDRRDLIPTYNHRDHLVDVAGETKPREKKMDRRVPTILAADKAAGGGREGGATRRRGEETWRRRPGLREAVLPRSRYFAVGGSAIGAFSIAHYAA